MKESEHSARKTEQIKLQYEAVPDFDKNHFPKGSFLQWTANTQPHRDEIVQPISQDITPVYELLHRVAEVFPNLRICRISSFEDLLGEGDFFVGNIQAAQRNLCAELRPEALKNPVLVSAQLNSVLKLLRAGRVTISQGMGSDLRLLLNGSINLTVSSLDAISILNNFLVTKPPNGKIDQSLYVNFRQAVFLNRLMHLLKLA